jgi:hypothetical protein
MAGFFSSPAIRLALLSAALFVAACCAPALEFERSSGESTTFPGIGLLGLGWLALFAGQFSWLANPFYLASMILLLCKRPMFAIGLAVVALLFTSDALRLFSTTLPADEGGVNTLTLKRLHAGYYLWVGSAVVLVAAGVVQYSTAKRAEAAAV